MLPDPAQASAGAPNAAPSPGQSQVSSELGLLESAIVDLTERLVVLERRLEPVVRPGEDHHNDPEPEVMLVPVAGTVRELRKQVNRAATRVMELVDRLEV